MTDSATTEADREEQRSLVERVVRVVEYQTTEPQPDRAAEATILTVLSSHADHPPDEVRAALDRAVEQGRLKTDGDHYWRPESDA